MTEVSNQLPPTGRSIHCFETDGRKEARLIGEEINMIKRALAGLFLAAAVICCSKEPTTPQGSMRPAAGTRSPISESADECPMAVPGSRVQLQATNDALALTFTGPTGELAQLRERVRHLADACTSCGTFAGAVGVEDLPIGARIVFAPSDPAHVRWLRDQLRDAQQRMINGECWRPCAGRDAPSSRAPE